MGSSRLYVSGNGTILNPSLRVILGTAGIDNRYGSVRDIGFKRNRLNWEELLDKAGSLGFSGVDTATGYEGAHQLIGESEWQGPVHTKISQISETSSELREAKKLCRVRNFEIVYFHDSSLALHDPKQVSIAAKFLRANGVKNVGLSVYDLKEFDACLEIDDINVIQIPANPLDQRFSTEVVSRARNKGKFVFARSLFLQGLLLANRTPPKPIPQQLSRSLKFFHDYCDRSDLHPILVCSKYVARISGISGIIVGVDDVRQAREFMNYWTQATEQSEETSIPFGLFSAEAHLVDPRRW